MSETERSRDGKDSDKEEEEKGGPEATAPGLGSSSTTG